MSEPIRHAPIDRAPLGKDALDFSGKVVVVTGGARGLGAGCVSLFHRLGATVATCDRIPTDEFVDGDARGHDPVIWRSIIDVRDASSVERFVDTVAHRFGQVDVLVNNAGGTFVADFADVNEKGEASLIAENFTQVTRLIRLCLPHIPAEGSIIQVTSIEGSQAAPGFAVYAAMKAACESLTKTLALELAPRAIRVNAVAPDAIPSEGEREARKALLDAKPTYMPAFVPPLGYFGSPEDAAGPIAFLASPLARFLTGVILQLDGGNKAASGWHRQIES